MKTFAVKFFEARTAAGLTHEQAAKDLCATSYISLIESGKRLPSRKLLKAFSQRFGVALEISSENERSQQVELDLLDASIAIDEGDLSRAESALEKLNNSNLTPELNAKRSLQMSRIASRRLDFDHALEILESLLFEKRFQTLSLSTKESIWIEYFRACYDSGNLPQATLKGSELVASGELNKFSPTTQVTIKCQLAGCHLEVGNNLQAIRLANEASDLAHLLEEPRALARAEWQVATVASSNDRPEEAAEWMRKAVMHAEQAEMKDSAHRMKIALASILVEGDGQELTKLEAQMELVSAECVLAEKLVDAAYACTVLSEICIKRKDFERAAETAATGLQYLKGDSSGPFIELKLNLARCEFEKNQDLDSWFATIREVDQLEGHGAPVIKKHWTELARAAMERGEAKMAAEAYENALEAKKRKLAGLN